MAKILTQEEANELLDLLKKCVKEYVIFPNKKQKECFDVIADDIRDKKSMFIININRANKFADDKISFSARCKQDDILLLRLDIGDDINGRPPLEHTNPIIEGAPYSGKHIVGSHLHIYKENYAVTYAIPFQPESEKFVEIFFEFLEYFKVKEPKIRQQISTEEL